MARAMKMIDDLTELQRSALARVLLHTAESGRWYRASRNGERVTLVSLYRRGILKRRAWRGVEGSADAAHEYRLSDTAKAEWDALRKDTGS
jgi:hypothetical protein